MTGLNSPAVIQSAIDHLLATGLFESVQGHEAVSSPGNGLTADVWFDAIKPVPAQSGLAESSAVLTLWARMYLNADALPIDNIEQTMASATDTMMIAYSGGFTFGGLVEAVDLLGGLTGIVLSAQGGYVDIGGVRYRCVTITIPCLIADVWPQAA
jgi:hypothetical protein